MYLSDLMASLRRRRWLVLAAVIVAVGLCGGAAKTLTPQHESQANVVLIPPESTVDKGGNPYLYLGNLGQAVDVLIRAVNSDQVRAAVSDRAPDGGYEITSDWTTSAPMMILTVKAHTSDEVTRLQSAVLDQIPVALTHLQDDLAVPANSRIETKVVSSDAVPRVDKKSMVQTLAILGAGSLFAMLLVIAAYDNLRLRLARRKAAAHPVARPEPAEGPGDADAPPPSRSRVGTRA